MRVPYRTFIPSRRTQHTAVHSIPLHSTTHTRTPASQPARSTHSTVVLFLFLFVIPLPPTLDTFVKDTHGFIGGPDLDLGKVGLRMVTGGTDGRRPIDMFPGGGSAENIIMPRLLLVVVVKCRDDMFLVVVVASDRLHVGTSGAVETGGARRTDLCVVVVVVVVCVR